MEPGLDGRDEPDLHPGPVGEIGAAMEPGLDGRDETA